MIMYTPSHFKRNDPSTIHSFIRDHSFGLLLSVSNEEIHDTHTPFLLIETEGVLMGHIARANPQWKGWKRDSLAKAIFTGPHAYISPNYYASEFNVPTWNYTAVSVSGAISAVQDEEEILTFLERLTAQSEPNEGAWAFDRHDERYLKLTEGIVVFRISMDKVEASFKLNQNKPIQDQQSVINSLSSSACPFDQGVASLMQGNINTQNYL